MQNITNELQAIKDVSTPKREKDLIRLTEKVVKRSPAGRDFIVNRDGFYYATDFQMMFRVKTESEAVKHIGLYGKEFLAVVQEDNRTYSDELQNTMPDFEHILPSLQDTGHIKTLDRKGILELFNACQKTINSGKKIRQNSFVAIRTGNVVNWFSALLVSDALRFFLQTGENEIEIRYNKVYPFKDLHPLYFYTENKMAYVMPTAANSENVDGVYVDLL